MSADDVRASFQPPEGGFFMVGSEGGEPVLVWRPRGRASDGLDEARFEFEEGALARARFAFSPGYTRADVTHVLRLPDEDDERIAIREESGRGPVVVYAASH
jgi:hypothetical protein